MKLNRLSALLLASLLAAPVIAHAHPGHDGDHDFVWDVDHLASHPLATLACATMIAAGGWAMWKLLRNESSPKAVRARSRDHRR
jgi:hydrogenase/urease accessory protein HupE